MPGWSEINEDIQRNGNGNFAEYALQLCQKYLLDIHSVTGRNVIAYYSGWLNCPSVSDCSIVETDKNAFMNAIYNMDRNKGLDIVLHTPGGDIAATESIVSYLKSAFNGDIRAIVPQISMSAGTMIAISCKEIVMGRQSSLGPIDPQLNGIACQMVVEEFYRAVSEVKANPASLGLWQTIISKYHPTYLTMCEDAVKWSEKLAEEWLKDVNPKINVAGFKNVFINHTNSFSHSRHISREECRRAGLNIVEMEANQDLQEAVLSLHHCFMVLSKIIPVVKMVLNQDGRTWIQTATSKMNN